MEYATIKLQNSDRSHNSFITVRERDALLYSVPPQAIRVSKLRAKGQTYRLLPPVVPLRDMHEASAPSITMSDMLANVGLSRKFGERAPRRRQQMARDKIEMFKPTFRFTLSKEIADNGLVFSGDLML